MENNTFHLIHQVEQARSAFIDSIKGLSVQQIEFKPSEQEWSILQITEHLVWAEQIGVCGMFNAIQGIKSQQPIWEGTSPNIGLSIEQIVDKTWQPKEIVPKVAEPRWGGTISFWIASLKNCSALLVELEQMAQGIDLSRAIYPHPISGPMDVIQRLEFLRFHLERHQKQVERLKSHLNFQT